MTLAEVSLNVNGYIMGTAIVGLAGWVLSHTVNRKVHLNGRSLVHKDVCEERYERIKQDLTEIKADVKYLREQHRG